jgi:hypothetical protein
MLIKVITNSFCDAHALALRRTGTTGVAQSYIAGFQINIYATGTPVHMAILFVLHTFTAINTSAHNCCFKNVR